MNHHSSPQAPGLQRLFSTFRTQFSLLSLGLLFWSSALHAQAPVKYRATPYTLTAPPLQGTYKPFTRNIHPAVFTDQAELERLLADTSPTVRKALTNLEAQVNADLAKSADLTAAPYSGCDINHYITEFAYGGKGATTIMPQLAMYSYLTSLKKGYGNAELAAKSTALAKTIMLNWANHGWRNGTRFRNTSADFCAGPTETTPQRIVWHLIALQAGRGMPNWIQAQDLLYGIDAFAPAEKDQLNQFLRDMFSLLVTTSYNKALDEDRNCDRVNNQTSATLAGMAAIARFKNDGDALKAIADGTRTTPQSIEILVPWTLQMQGNIYGQGEELRGCYPLETSVRFSNYFQLDHPAAGEVDDRYRGHKNQPFGYALGSVSYLMVTAQILHDAGFDTFHYKGDHGQSIQVALDYYSYYFTRFLDIKDSEVPDKDPGSPEYPSFQQYIGQPVSHGDRAVTGTEGILAPYIFALRAYPNDRKIDGVLEKAMSFSGQVTPLYGFDTLALPYLPLLETLSAPTTPVTSTPVEHTTQP